MWLCEWHRSSRVGLYLAWEEDTVLDIRIFSKHYIDVLVNERGRI